jgi:hypothetical protein
MGTFPLGTAIGGALAAAVGLRGAMILAAFISFLPFIPVAASPMRSLQDLSDVYVDRIRREEASADVVRATTLTARPRKLEA